jgi:hypothetical protein
MAAASSLWAGRAPVFSTASNLNSSMISTRSVKYQLTGRQLTWQAPQSWHWKMAFRDSGEYSFTIPWIIALDMPSLPAAE